MAASRGTIEQLARDTARLADPETALRALTALRQELDATEPDLVLRALQAGASWSRIARALGISKQAAHRKYRYLFDHAMDASTGGPKLLVTPEARQSMQFAREEAKRLGQPAVGTEHVLLGILHCRESYAVRALNALGVTLETARELPSDDDAGAHAEVIASGAIGPRRRDPSGTTDRRRLLARGAQTRRGSHRRRARVAGPAVRFTERRGPDPRGSADHALGDQTTPRARTVRSRRGNHPARHRRGTVVGNAGITVAGARRRGSFPLEPGSVASGPGPDD